MRDRRRVPALQTAPAPRGGFSGLGAFVQDDALVQAANDILAAVGVFQNTETTNIDDYIVVLDTLGTALGEVNLLPAVNEQFGPAIQSLVDGLAIERQRAIDYKTTVQ